MALRPASELGLVHPTEVRPRRQEPEPAPGHEPDEQPQPPRKPRQRPSSNGAAATQTGAEGSSAAPVAAPQGVPLADESTEPNEIAPAAEPATVDEPRERKDVPLADEPSTFLQVMAPGELHERLNDVSHALAAEHHKLRHQKTILGALIWRHVHPDDPESLRQLGATLDAYLSTDLAEAPAEIKVGAHLPFSLKYKLDGAAIALRRTRRDASAKTLLSALVWRHVHRGDLATLIELLTDYYDVVRPRPLPLAQPGAT